MNDSLGTAAMMGMLIALLPIIGAMMAITPYLMKKSEVFAVTVPEIAISDPSIRRMKRTYAGIIVAVTVVFTGVSTLFWIIGSEAGVLILAVAGSLFLTAFGYALMLYYRTKVKRYKQKMGWEAQAQEAVALISEQEVPKAISLKWNFLYLPIMVLTLAIGFAGYSHMPDIIPMQVGFDGEISRAVEKSLIIPVVPVLIQAFFAVCLIFSHWMITRSKRLSEPGAPTTSALAYGMFAHANSIFLLATGLLLCILMIAMPLSFMGTLTLMQAGTLIMVGAIIIVIGSIAIAVVYGQGGARLFRRMGDSETLLTDNDAFWKLGIFYWNKEDPSLFLPARFGIGWTINWARPAVWLIMVAGIFVIAAFVIAILLFA